MRQETSRLQKSRNMSRFTIETEDEEEHRGYLNGPALHAAVWDLWNDLRGKAKHSETEPQSWDEVKDLVWSHVGEEMGDA